MDAEMAICKSLEELEHTRAYCHKIKLYEPRLPLDSNYENMVVAQKDHLNFWCDETHLPLADFLFSPVEEINFSEIASLTSGDAAQDLQLLVDKITYTGHRVLIADLTTPDVAELGLSVVRALIPGFHPLFMGHRYRALGGKRLWQMPAQMGYNSINGDNPVPHPFP
jgi:ribosomal protein S12 methylthiotransferase accessory factor